MCDTRRLTSRELATIRAALRLWLDVPVAAIPASVHIELDALPPLDDGDVEQLIGELANPTAELLVRAVCRSLTSLRGGRELR